MCLVLSVLLTALAINFYINGFFIQAIMTGAVALLLLIGMIRNVGCRKTGCGIDFKVKEDER